MHNFIFLFFYNISLQVMFTVKDELNKGTLINVQGAAQVRSVHCFDLVDLRIVPKHIVRTCQNMLHESLIVNTEIHRRSERIGLRKILPQLLFLRVSAFHSRQQCKSLINKMIPFGLSKIYHVRQKYTKLLYQHLPLYFMQTFSLTKENFYHNLIIWDLLQQSIHGSRLSPIPVMLLPFHLSKFY